MGFSAANIDELEKHLAENPYLSDSGLPNHVDAQVYLDFKGKPSNYHLETPDVNKTPNTHFWYMFMLTFSNELLKKWVEKAAPKEKGGKKKQEKKEAPKDEGDDLFDDEPTTAPTQPVKKPEVKKKKVTIAKSIVVFDVKVYDTETDLDELSKKIRKIEMDGLVWNNQPKKIEVAFGIFKLQMGCVIEDAKILTDDIFDPIEEWEEVQSVDMVSMQKL